MRRKKSKQSPRVDPTTAHNRTSGRNSILGNSGWIQNISAALLVIGTATICGIMKMSVLRTSVITACLLVTVLVWIIGITIIRTYDSGEENPAFAVAVETSYVGNSRDAGQIFFAYNQRWISPAPIALFIRIVNLQQVPTNIRLLKVEILSIKHKWLPDSWLEPTHVPDDVALIWVSPLPTPARRLALIGPRLTSILELRPIQPNETVAGWVLFDAPLEYDSAPQPPVFRITVRDTAGHKLSVIASGPTGDNIAAPTRGFDITTDIVDVNGLQVKHFSDH
jgi:hypothetical protein